MALLELSLRNIACAKNIRLQCFLLVCYCCVDLIVRSMMHCDTSDMKFDFEDLVWFIDDQTVQNHLGFLILFSLNYLP